MGGLVLLGLWTTAVLVFSLWRPLSVSGLFVLASGLIMGAIGALDDLLSLRLRRSMGLSGWRKIALISIGAALLFWLFHGAIPSYLRIPFAQGSIALPLVARFALTWIVFLSTTNAFNLTDGLDGLAAGIAVLVFLGFAILVPSAACRLALPLIFILLGFLWFNAHPARLFLGDVGAFAIGGIVAGVALTSGTSLILPILAGIPALEVASVVGQVLSVRLLGRRLFRMSPLHHHFEACPSPPPHPSVFRGLNWPESQVVVRFWILQALFVAVAVLAGRVGE
jgi:phospho-N-acetylmuramoyl-pentapeptide-transferase